MFDLNSLKSITQEELNKMINEHEKWYKFKGCPFFIQLRLIGYNLSNLKIKSKNLRYILFRGCLLNNVLFEDCDLKNSTIEYSEIKNTNFVNCNLSYGNFLYNEFLNADLSSCNIKNSHFDATLFNNVKMPDYLMVCPQQGSFIGYKKVRDINKFCKRYILKLEIPEDARRSSAIGIKCRCDKAKVLEIQHLNGKIVKNVTKVKSLCNNKIIYELGKTIEEPKFDECRWHECAPGIHFFMNKEEAVNYMKF